MSQALFRMERGPQAAVIIPLKPLDRTKPRPKNGKLRKFEEQIVVDFYCEFPGCVVSAEVYTTAEHEKSALPKGWSCLWVWSPVLETPIEFELCKEHGPVAIQPWMLEAPPEHIGKIAEQADVRLLVDAEEEEPCSVDEDEEDSEELAAFGLGDGDDVVGDPPIVPAIAFFGDEEDDEDVSDVL